MFANTNADGGYIYTLHVCETCMSLIRGFPDIFCDEYGVFEGGCVWYSCNDPGPITPEQLMEELTNKNLKPLSQ